MRFVLGSNIRVIDPSLEVLFWAQQELKLSNPEYERKLRMNKWTGNTPKHILLYELDGTDLILPYGSLKMMPIGLLREGQWETTFSDAQRVNYGNAEIGLYDYQQTACNVLEMAKGGILQSPAGSGKTQIGIALAMALGRRTLWLTHTQDLLKQSRERALRYMDASLTGTVTEGKVHIGTGITFATIQTMCKLDLNQYRDTWDVIIVDECHRVAGSPLGVTMFSKVLNALRARHKYGLSATVHRSDGLIKSTYALLGPVVHEVPAEAVADKIMQVTVKSVNTGIGMSDECVSPDGMLDYAKLINYLTQSYERNALIKSLITMQPRHSWLILTDRVEHSAELISMLPPELQLAAVTINGKMTSKKGKAEREAAIEQMRTGEKRFLFATYTLAKEGLDIPRLDRLIMATPQGDYAVIVQSLGRIARTFPGKDTPICFDLVDNIPYLIKRFKKRCTSYRKVGAIIK